MPSRNMLSLLLLALFLAWAGPARAEDAAASNTVHVIFFSYQQIKGQYYFQIIVGDPPPGGQPGLKKTGDQARLGTLGPFTIGAFHQATSNVTDPATGKTVPIDTSTVEIVDPVTKHTARLPFRREVILKAGLATRHGAPPGPRSLA